MSIFGIITGLLIIVIVFYYENINQNNSLIDDLLEMNKISISRNIKNNYIKNISDKNTKFENIRGPYLNTFNSTNYFPNNSKLLWQYCNSNLDYISFFK